MKDSDWLSLDQVSVPIQSAMAKKATHGQESTLYSTMTPGQEDVTVSQAIAPEVIILISWMKERGAYRGGVAGLKSLRESLHCPPSLRTKMVSMEERGTTLRP